MKPRGTPVQAPKALVVTLSVCLKECRRRAAVGATVGGSKRRQLSEGFTETRPRLSERPRRVAVEPPGRVLQIAVAHDVVPIKTARVLWPVSFIATSSGTAVRTRLRTAVRRKS